MPSLRRRVAEDYDADNSSMDDELHSSSNGWTPISHTPIESASPTATDGSSDEFAANRITRVGSPCKQRFNTALAAVGDEQRHQQGQHHQEIMGRHVGAIDILKGLQDHLQAQTDEDEALRERHAFLKQQNELFAAKLAELRAQPAPQPTTMQDSTASFIFKRFTCGVAGGRAK